MNQAVRSDDVPSVSAAQEELSEAEADVAKAKKRLKNAKNQIEDAETQLTEGELEEERTKLDLANARLAQGIVAIEIKQAKAERDAAIEVRNAMQAGGATYIDPAVADATDIALTDIVFDSDVLPAAKLDKVEAQVAEKQAEYVTAIGRAGEARLKEDDLEERAADVVRDQDSARETIEAAEQKRQKAQKARKSAKRRVDEAEETVEQAEIAQKRAEEAALAARSMERPGSGGITSPYGMRTHPITGAYKLHSGTDFGYGDGNARAARAGTVASVTYDGAYGNMVTISHGKVDSDDVQTRYAHLSGATVSTGEKVEAGEKIGNIGSTGYSTGPHLHFEVLVNGDFADPMEWLNN